MYISKICLKGFFSLILGVDDSNLAHVLEQINLEAECQLLPGSRTSNSALYLLNGLLSCGKYEILLAIDPKWEDFVIFKLFPIIIDLCKDSKQNLYHAFNVLLSWVKFVHKHLKRLFSNQKDTRCTESWFGGDSVFVNSILSILNVNWTCSVIGVTDILKEIYTLLIDIHVSEEKLCGLKGTLVERLFNQTMEQPWTLKQRYPPLAILMRYVNFEKVSPDALFLV